MKIRVLFLFALSLALVSASSIQAADPDVQVLLNGKPAATGTYTFPFAEAGEGLVLDNGLVRFTFNRDDGTATGWNGTDGNRKSVSITATSIVVNGTELAHHLSGVNPRDPSREHTFYIDAGGGKSRLVCTQVKVLRVTPELAEVAFTDVTSTPLQHEHHLILRKGRRGIYGYDIMTAAAATTISEVRMNTRWDRSIFDHVYNWERGSGQQPTYAYLETQKKIGDETWQVDDKNNAGLPAGAIYTKYNWSLYHHENPMFGHYGHGFGVWFTALGGVTDQTLSAFYGVGPNHQDLAIHQDALILNYFGANHYALPGYALFAGYRRLYGPWLTYITVGDAAKPEVMIADAAAIAKEEIAANRNGAAWVDDTLYAKPAERTMVTGRIKITDGRPADGLWVLLSTQDVDEVYTIHEPTYFVKTDAEGRFTLPGIPPATLPGKVEEGTYTLYVFSAKGSVTEQFKKTGLKISGAKQDLGTIAWTPEKPGTFLWQIGRADRMGGEFALATNPADFSNPRAYEKAAEIPADLNFTIGKSWEPKDWYYAQTKAGTWTVTFTIDRVYSGTAVLTVATSMQQSGKLRVAVNGSSEGLSGMIPESKGSVISRQADRSGFPRTGKITFPADKLVVGENKITFTREGQGLGGVGWDTLVLQVNEPTAPPPAQLSARLVVKSKTATDSVWTLTVTNTGKGPANHALMNGFGLSGKSGAALPMITSRDPNRFPVPLGVIAPGASVSTEIALDTSKSQADAEYEVNVPFSANGGLATGVLTQVIQ